MNPLFQFKNIGLLTLMSMLIACTGEVDPNAGDLLGNAGGSPESNSSAGAGGVGGSGGSGTVAGERVFDESVIHTVVLKLSSDDWQALIDDGEAPDTDHATHEYVRAQLTFDGEKLSGDVGLRIKGHISIVLAEGHSYPFKIDFNRFEKGLALDGLKKLNIHADFDGPTLPIMRDYLSYGAWREFADVASRTSFARVTVNDEDLGIYTLVEQVDGGFLKRHFDKPWGDLYKPEQQSGSLIYAGDNISDYPDIGHKWPDESDHQALLNALKVLQTASGSELAEVFDIDSVLTYMAGYVALGNWDYYPITGHNYYLYEQSPGKFGMLPWDLNGSQEPDNPGLCSPNEGWLSGKILQDSTYEAKYFELVSKFLQSGASKTWLTSRLNAAEKLLGSSISAEEVAGLRKDIAARTARLQSELANTTTCQGPTS